MAHQQLLEKARKGAIDFVKAYQVWADGLKPMFIEILGPPAKTDHAPPSTGDPSAKPRQAAPQNQHLL